MSSIILYVCLYLHWGLFNSLQNVITDATRQAAILDPIIIPDDMSYMDAGVLSIPNNISDHKVTFVTLPLQYEMHGTFTRLVWIYKKVNFPLSKDKISNFDWTCLNEGTVDEACRKFTDVFFKMVKLCIPSKTVVVRPSDKPWYDSEIRHFSSKRDRVKTKLVKIGSLILREKYRKLLNKVYNLKKQAKEKFFNNLESSISDFYSNDKRQFWSIIRHFVKNNSKTSSIPPLKSFPPNGQNEFCYTDTENNRMFE